MAHVKLEAFRPSKSKNCSVACWIYSLGSVKRKCPEALLSPPVFNLNYDQGAALLTPIHQWKPLWRGPLMLISGAGNIESCEDGAVGADCCHYFATRDTARKLTNDSQIGFTCLHSWQSAHMRRSINLISDPHMPREHTSTTPCHAIAFFDLHCMSLHTCSAIAPSCSQARDPKDELSQVHGGAAGDTGQDPLRLCQGLD